MFSIIFAVTRANGAFEVVERDLRDPAPGELRIKVEACGVCHGDLFTKSGGANLRERSRLDGAMVVPFFGRTPRAASMIAPLFVRLLSREVQHPPDLYIETW